MLILCFRSSGQCVPGLLCDGRFWWTQSFQKRFVLGWHRCRSDRSLVRLLKRDFVRLTTYSSSVHISLLLLSFSHIVIIVALHDHLNMTFVLSGPTWFFEHATTTVIFYRSYTQPHSNSRSARHRLFWLYIHIFLQPQILDGYIAMMFVIVKERPLLKLIFDRFLSVFFFSPIDLKSRPFLCCCPVWFRSCSAEPKNVIYAQ